MDEAVFRLVFAALLASGISISAYYRWRARKATGVIPRRRESWSIQVARIFFVLPILAVIVDYVLGLRWMSWSEVALSGGLRWVGVVTGAAAVLMAYWVLSSLGSNISETVLTKKDHYLVTGGPYRWVRHPLYTAGIFLLASLSLVAANWFMALVTLAGAAALPALVRREEAALLEKFDAEYREYAERTGRFLPRLLR